MKDRWECKRWTRKLRKLLPKPGRKPVMICSETGRFYKSALLRCDSTSHSDEKLYTARQLPQAPHLCFSYLQLPSDVYFRKTYHNSFLFQPQESIISTLLHFKNMIKAENHLLYMIILCDSFHLLIAEHFHKQYFLQNCRISRQVHSPLVKTKL